MSSHQTPETSSSRSLRKAKGKLVALAPCKPRQKAKTVEGVTYSCSTCAKEFDNAQALGGHQNAHRRDREEEERMYKESREARLAAAYRPPPMAADPHMHGYMYGVRPQIWYGPVPNGHRLHWGGQNGVQPVNMVPPPPLRVNQVGGNGPQMFEFIPANRGAEAGVEEELDLSLHL